MNGADTGVTASGDTRHAQLTYTPATPLQGQVHVSVQSNDLNIPTANSKQREVIRYTTTNSTQTLTGDLDHDGRVDGSDLVVLARSFGAHQGDVFYDSVADLNDDGLVDGVDLAELATNFGKSIS